ncbi:TIGR01212 family radical SAM protein [candidate division KSB1 bacterium]|nr:TIGR01212 family radical SAM protein [candidate division KSB1 bacterium]
MAQMQSFYNKFSDFMRLKYGQNVWKISLDAGLSCPNRTQDGKEGCIFCRNDSFSAMGARRQMSIRQQMQEGIALARQKRGIRKFLAYFQSSTNTFAPVTQLAALYEQALAFDDVVGIAISTRPDCLPANVIELIRSLTDRCDVWVELGLQSSHDATLAKIHRGHTFADYERAVAALQKINVRICSHVIIGLPGESRDEIITTAGRVASSGIDEVKIHPLLILRETPLDSMYRRGEIQPLAMADYVSLAVDFVEQLPPHMVIQRLTAESRKNILVEPQWCANKSRVLGAIDAEFAKRGTRQGAACQSHA